MEFLITSVGITTEYFTGVTIIPITVFIIGTDAVGTTIGNSSEIRAETNNTEPSQTGVGIQDQGIEITMSGDLKEIQEEGFLIDPELGQGEVRLGLEIHHPRSDRRIEIIRGDGQIILKGDETGIIQGDNKVILTGRGTETLRKSSGLKTEKIRRDNLGSLKEGVAETLHPIQGPLQIRITAINKKVLVTVVERADQTEGAATEGADLQSEAENQREDDD